MPASDGSLIIFLDGAGGGGPIIDSSRDVDAGLREAGYRGEFRSFHWQTDLGPLADLCLPEASKRARAAELASQIDDYVRQHPQQPVSIIAASAGTAVAVFALEALGPGERVDSAVLLSPALSATYNLRPALEHVARNMYVFVSQRDALMRVLVPLLGTADRRFVGENVAGLVGFAPPTSQPTASATGTASEAARPAPYERLTTIVWSPTMRGEGHFGGHTDYKNARFIADVIAPRLLAEPPTDSPPMQFAVGP